MVLQIFAGICFSLAFIADTLGQASSPGERLLAYGRAVDECFGLVNNDFIDCAQVTRLAIALDRAHQCQRELDQSEMEISGENLDSWKADRKTADERFAHVRVKLASKLASIETESLAQPKFEPVKPPGWKSRGGTSGITLFRIKTPWGEEAEIDEVALRQLLNELPGVTPTVIPVIADDWETLVHFVKTDPAAVDAVKLKLPSKTLDVLAGQIAVTGGEPIAAKLRAAADDKALKASADFFKKNADHKDLNLKLNELDGYLKSEGAKPYDFQNFPTHAPGNMHDSQAIEVPTEIHEAPASTEPVQIDR